MGRLYKEMGEAKGSRSDITKAIQNYELALKEDPSSSVILEDLTELYLATNRFQDAITEADDLLKVNPDNLGARKMLARVYTKAIGSGQGGGVNEDAMKKALDQYQRIVQKDPKDVESYVMIGRLQSYLHNTPEAEKAFMSALSAQPDSEDAMVGLSELYGQMGDSKKAVEKLKDFVDKNPSVNTLTALAKAYEDEEDYKDAAGAWQKAMDLAPDDDRIASGAAKALLYSDQPNEALKIYEKLAAENPRDPEVQLRMCEVYLGKNDIPKARAALDKAKAQAPTNLQVRYQEVAVLEAEDNLGPAIAQMKSIVDETGRRTRGSETGLTIQFLDRLALLYRKNSQFKEAADTFRKAADVDPAKAPGQTAELIETLREAKDLPGATKEAEAALKKFPDDKTIRMEYASVLVDGGKADEAVSQLKAAAGSDKLTFPMDLQLAAIYEQAKRYKEMAGPLNDADKLAKSDSDHEMVHFRLGAMYEHLKQYDQAETEFRKVLAINPDNFETLNYLGYMLADQNRKIDEAYEMVKRALDMQPGSPAFMDSLAWVYYHQGKLEDAVGLLTRALEKQKDPTMYDHLGDVYSKLGKTKEAVEQWQASVNEYNHGNQSETDPDEMTKVRDKLRAAEAQLAKGHN